MSTKQVSAVVAVSVVVVVLSGYLVGLRAEEVSGAASPAESVLVVFTEQATSGKFASDSNIGAQLLSLAGSLLWEKGERSVAVSGAKVLERNPVAVPDGVGGYIVAFEVEFLTGEQGGDVDIYAQRLSADGRRLWNDGERAVPVAASVWRERRPVIVPDGQGGAIVIFEEHGAPDGEYAGDIDVGAQRISPTGKLLWNRGEKSATVASSKMPEQVPTAVPDGQGGVIVVFEVTVTSGQYQGDVDLFAQHLDASGAPLWNQGQASTQVATSPWRERRAQAAADGQGGAIVVFEQHGAPGGKYEGDIDVAVQRISSEGKRLWGDQGALAVAEAEEFLERAPTLLVDGGTAGTWIIFEMEAREGEYQGDSEIAAQRVTPTGTLLWTDGPKEVATSKWSERAPVVVTDGAGGIIVAFEEHAPETDEFAGDIDVGAQRLSPTGDMLWNEAKKSATVSSSSWLERQPRALADGAGGILVVCEAEARQGESAGDIDVFAQHLDASGAMLWNEGERSTVVASSRWKELAPRLAKPQ